MLTALLFRRRTQSSQPFKERHRYFPQLPLELWIRIIREASTMAPDPLDITNGVTFLESSPCKLHAYRVSIQMKHNFSLVSKLWNRFTQEVLYEFVWISRASQAKALALTLLSQECVRHVRSSGMYIRRLHIETPTLERCAPDDLRTILDYSPRLLVYSDHFSVRRSRYQEACDNRSSPQQLFQALTHPNNHLRRLSWTNYDNVSFHPHMSPMLKSTAANLEYLELSLCSPNFPPHLTEETTLSPSHLSVAIALPTLRSLKVTLDNGTFADLASWEMPQLANLSVVSSDFSYAGAGFQRFFSVHGPKLVQLELGHSSSTIEEHYLTMPSTHQQPIPLADWCPNLREFICSADAEWNWQNPDWIAPHILLPTHPKLELIGIRDIDKRLIDDASVVPSAPLWDHAPFFPLLEQLSSLLRTQAFPSLRYIRDLSEMSDAMRRRPQLRVIKFWTKLLLRCQERQVWLEDCHGVNVTSRDLMRASRNCLTS